MQLSFENKAAGEALAALTRAVRDSGGRALVVGGSVRDFFLELPAKDVDVEVYGIPAENLKALLASRFEIDLVGEAFGVIKIHGLPIDISIPRRESKAGMGHKGFDVMSDPAMSNEEAARRRDFTINSMAWDPADGNLLDPFGGREDLAKKLLRHTSEKFSEDPLRVLRGMQFAARFDLTAAPETVALCATMQTEGLARERIFEEWKKLVLKGARPSKGLQFLRESGWIRFFPELESLVGCTQDPAWHPEGDVWTHTLLCMDAFAEERTGSEREDLVVGLAVLCHDLGKPATSAFERGRMRSLGHAEAGEPVTRAFLSRMTNEEDLIAEVTPLVVDHLKPLELFEARAGDSAIRRLAVRVKRIDRLVRVARADQKGRGAKPFDGFPGGEWLLERAHELQVRESAPKPIVMGRHLLPLGVEPGPYMGSVLRGCYEAQIDGRVKDLESGIECAKQLLEAESREQEDGRGG